MAIDPAKTFHKVLLFDFNLDIIEGPFDIDVLRSGWEQLLSSIHRAKRLRKARRVVIGLEASGNYSATLTRELTKTFTDVYCFNPLTVATARKQKLLLGQKTDAIDVAVIGDLLLRGQGYRVPQPTPVYAELRELTYWRHYRAHLVGKLRQQIADRFDRVFPGMTVRSNGTKPLVCDLKHNPLPHILIEQGLTPSRILSMPASALRERLRAHRGRSSKPSVERLQAHLRGTLLSPEPTATFELQLLQRDLRLLQAFQREITEVERDMVRLVQHTPGRHLLGQLRGLSDIQIASYIGALGDPTHYPSAKHVYSMAGLCPRQHESGTTKPRKQGITKMGRQVLRTLLFQMASFVAMHEPRFREYRQRLWKAKGKRFMNAQLATANKLNRTIFAIMRDGSAYRRGDAVSRCGP